MLYELLFGIAPPSYVKSFKSHLSNANYIPEPIDSFYYEVFSEELVQDILSKDFG